MKTSHHSDNQPTAENVQEAGRKSPLPRLVRWLFAPRELIRIQQIEIRKLQQYNGSLAQENFELWAEIARLNSPLAAAREARMAAEMEAALQKDRDTNPAR